MCSDGALNSKILVFSGTLLIGLPSFPLNGITFPYFPDFTSSSVKLVLSFKLQYLGHIYQNFSPPGIP